MPSTYAHYTFGERMLPLFPAKIRSLIQENRALYDIGLHGPDILFYYKALCSNEVNAVGYKMHDKPGADFLLRPRRSGSSFAPIALHVHNTPPIYWDFSVIMLWINAATAMWKK